MPRIEFTSGGDKRTFLNEVLAVNFDIMPVAGWITEIGMRAAGSTQANNGRLILFDGNVRIFMSSSQSWGTTLTMRTATMTEKVGAASSLYWGVYTGADQNDAIEVDAAAKNNHNIKAALSSSPPSILPSNWDNSSAYIGHKLRGYLDYVAQVSPTPGAFQSPTPAEGGLVTGSTPTVSGTTPHGNGDGSVDETEAVQLQVYNTDDPTIIYQDIQFAPTSSERAAKTFSKQLAALPASAAVTVRFRHQDTWGAWSGWSATRSFNMSAGPDAPALSRPVGKVDYRNETEYQAAGGTGSLYRGSYNNPAGAALHSVRVQVRNRSKSTIVADSMWINRTATSGVWTLPQGSFPSSGTGVVAHPAALEWGTEYSVRAKVREDNGSGGAGIESEWGDYADFNTNAFPTEPTNLSPSGGLATSVLDFSASVADPDGDLITGAQLMLVRMDNNVAVIAALARTNLTDYALGAIVRPNTSNGYRYKALNAGRTPAAQDITFPTTSGATIRDNPATRIANSTSYAVGATRLRRTVGAQATDTIFYEVTAITTGTSASSEPAAFGTTTTPGATIVDGGVTWTVRATIQWQQVGSESEFDMNVAGNNATLTVLGSYLTLGEGYKWRARARDAIGWGAWSDYVEFVYAAVPSVEVLSPQNAARTNLIAEPSAEFDTSAAPWWIDATHANVTADRYGDDAAYGDNSYSFSVTGANTFTRTSPKRTIDPTKPLFLQAEAKKLSGTSAFVLALLCYNASDVLTGTLYPSSIAATGAGGVNVPVDWTRYGGVVWPVGSGNTPALPANTTKVEVRIIPGQAAATDLLVDGVALEQIPAVYPLANWTNAQAWQGYFDGETRDYSDGTRFIWLGEPGASDSTGIPRVSAPQPVALFRYTHSLAMNGKRLTIDRRKRGSLAWQQIYDSGMVSASAASGDVVTLTIPPNVLRNEFEYRLRASARDTNGVTGSSAYAVFDVHYIGPPQLDFTLGQPAPERAENILEWEASALGVGTFVGYELARESARDPFTVIARVTNASTPEFTDPFPLSGEQYTYYIRQIELVGTDEVEGRWGRVTVICDYAPFSFMKDADDPYTYLAAFETDAQSFAAPEEDAPLSASLAWGQTKLSHNTGIARLQAGTVTAQFFADASVVYGVADADTRYENAREIIRRRRTVALLFQVPDRERVFAAIAGPASRLWSPPRLKGVAFPYQETNYSEDYYEREGWR